MDVDKEEEEAQQQDVDVGMMTMEEEDDDEPQFLNPADAVEVQVDDDKEPMEDEDEQEETQKGDPQKAAAAPDMSSVQFTSHTGPVYAVAGRLLLLDDGDTYSRRLSVISGGGDDRACYHTVTSTSVSDDDSNTTTTTTTESSSSKILSHAHTDSVSCVAMHGGEIMAAAGYDGAICVYSMSQNNNNQNELITTFEGPTDVEWLSFHPTGAVLLAGSAADGTVWMFHVNLKKCLQVFVGHEAAVTAGCFTKDGGKVAITASSDGTVRVWAPKTGLSKHVFRFSQAAGLTCMDVNEQKLVVVGAEDGQAHLCHVPSKKVVGVLAHHCDTTTTTIITSTSNNDDDDDELSPPMSVEAVGFCKSNPNWCATAGVDGVLKIWDTTSCTCRQVCRNDSSDNGGGITRLQWHDTLPIVFTATTVGTVQIWDARNGALLQTYSDGSSENAAVINDMQVLFPSTTTTTTSNDVAAVVLTGSDDSKVRVFHVPANVLSPQA